MDSKASSLLFLALLCLCSSTANAFDITKILSNYPEFSTFTGLLQQTGLTNLINNRQTITVLVVNNDAMDSLSGRPIEVVKRTLTVHFILDYFDVAKLSKLQKASIILTTLYQTTGLANDQQGFLNVTRTAQGITFGSAVQGAPLPVSLLGSVYSQPYNISVLKVDDIIEVPGIENLATAPLGAAGAPKKAPAPAPTTSNTPPPSAKTPAKSPAKAPPAKAPAAPATPPPSTTPPSTSPSPSTEGPVVEAPPEALTPADAPVSFAPEADSPVDDTTSGSSRMHVAGVAVIMGLIACMMGF